LTTGISEAAETANTCSGDGLRLKKNQTEYIPNSRKQREKRSMHIKIFATGGTIDKVYFDATSEYKVGPPNIAAVFGELNLGFTYAIESLMKKDSLDINDDDRKVIYKAVAEDPCDRILITHGTDSMVETAESLADIQGKTIVLTGALKPALFKTTDAVFNIGCAVAAVQTMAPGVYIAMNGRVFRHDNVKKNVRLGKFETIA
jgi:L-asparaginase